MYTIYPTPRWQDVSYPYDEINDAKKNDYVFFKGSHHWTDYGAYIGYLKLMQRIKQDFKDIKIVSLNEYNTTQTTDVRDEYDRKYSPHPNTMLRLNLTKYAPEIMNTKYTYYDNKKPLKVKVGKYIKDWEENKNGKYKIMLIGNSQNENLLQFLPWSARKLKFIRVNIRKIRTSEQMKIMKYYEKDILDFKPDILIFTYSVTNINHFKDLFTD